ncbi:hypothetical protein Tco_0990875 [Tanacetum coccineum]|uniref:Uncharacterized protein n=1 Tax=Tanacetum coccineum TaxID=301880 RepID=A0ABQ5EXP0_9ASTR
MGRNKEEGTLSEEHYVQRRMTTAHPLFDDIVDKDAAVNPDLEEKRTGFGDKLKVTARQGTITPRTLNFEMKQSFKPLCSYSNYWSYGKKHLKAAEVLVAISRPRGLSIPGPIQSQPQQPTQGTDTQRKIQAEWDAEEERKRFEELKKTKPKTTLRKPTSLAQERNQMMSFLKGQEGYKKFKGDVKERDAKKDFKERKATIAEEQPSKKPKLRTETIDELRNYLRIVDFEKNAQDRESLEGISMITELQLAERRYHYQETYDDRMLDHGMEVEVAM